MPSHVISMMSISDAETYRRYTGRTPPIVERYGGRFLARGGDVPTVEGDAYEDRLVILDRFADPEYQEAMAFRHASSEARIMVIDGDDNTLDPDRRL